MIPGLEAALAGRKKYIDDVTDTEATTGMGMGLGGGFSDGIRAASSKFAGHSFVEKNASGYAGIVNQGATCYLNSLLQTLYMTPEFRLAMYGWEYKPEDGSEESSLALQLQKLFANLQLSERGAISTGALTRAFGWRGSEAFVQHDVQECMAVIFEHLATMCSKTSISKHILEEQEGMLENYLTCQVCHESRTRPESFRALSLRVAGFGTLEESLQNQVSPEEMSGDNKVGCPTCDAKTDTLKGVRLTQVPLILTLQLQRFDFNWATMTRFKVNDAMTFPDRLNMANHVGQYATKDGEPPQVPGTESEYELFSVMMHSGSALSGHYFAYIKDLSTKKWLRFNDSAVDEITDAELQRVFGPDFFSPSDEAAAVSASPTGETPESSEKDSDVDVKSTKGGATAGAGGSGGGGAGSGSSPGTKTPAAHDLHSKPASSNAYMLVYRRVNGGRDLSGEQQLVSDAEVPSPLRSAIEADNKEYLDLKAEWDRERQVRRLRVFHHGRTINVVANENDTLRHLLELVREQALSGPTDLELSEAKAEGKTEEEAKAAAAAAAPPLPPDLPLDCFRLRAYDSLKGLTLAPLGDGDDSVTLKSLNVLSQKPLALETRNLGEDWPLWSADAFPLLLTALNMETLAYEPPVQVDVTGDLTLGSLRKAAEDKLGLHGRCRLVFLSGEEAKLLTDDSASLDKDLRIIAGDSVHVEVSDEPLSTDKDKSVIVRLWESVVNEVAVTFNNPLNPDPDAEDLSLLFDRRKTMAELKVEFARLTGMEIDKFKMHRTENGPEMKDMDKQLTYFGFVEGGKIWLAQGTPLLPGQYSVLVRLVVDEEETEEGDVAASGPKVDSPASTAAGAGGTAGADDAAESSESAAAMDAVKLRDLGELVVTAETTASELKSMIASAFASDGAPPMELIRLRELSGSKLQVEGQKLTKVYVDEKSLAANCRPGRLIDGKQIAVQRTLEPETVKADDVLLTIRRWHPEESRVGKGSEKCLSSTTTVAELFSMLADLSTIPVEHIMIAKPWTWQLKNVEELPKLKWRPTTTSKGHIGAPPFNFKHGSTVLYKDNREEEKWKPPEESDAPVTRTSHEGGGFRILTAAEQREQDELRAVAAAAEAAEREERSKLVAGALAATGADHPAAKYLKLIELGQPVEQVRIRMRNDGLDPAILDLPASGSAPSS